jgi:hypothetical protein
LFQLKKNKLKSTDYKTSEQRFNHDTPLLAFLGVWFEERVSLSCCHFSALIRPVRLDLSAESAAIQQCFSLTTNQRTVLSAQ